MRRRPVVAPRWVAAFAVGSLAIAGLSGCGGSSGSGSANEIRIGLVFPTSGAMAALGKDQSEGAKMVLQYANAHGGINGTKIKIFEGDSASAPATGATVAQRLIDQDQVQVIIGSYASGIATAIAPVAQRNRVTLWEVGAVAPTVSQRGNKYFLRTVGAAGTYAAADLDFVKNYLAGKLGKPAGALRIAVAHEDGAFGTSVANAITAQATANGLNVVTNIAYPETSSDMTPVVLRLKQATPDIVLIAPLVASTPLYWQAARTQGFNVKAIIGSAGFSSSAFVRRFGAKGVEGVYDVEAPAVAYMNSTSLSGPARTTLDTLRASFAKVEGHECLVHCGDGIGGAFVLTTDVLPRALKSGTVDGDSIAKAAASTDIPAGGTPQGFGAKFDSSGDNTRASSVIMQWQGGKLRVVYPSSLAVAAPIFPMPTWAER